METLAFSQIKINKIRKQIREYREARERGEAKYCLPDGEEVKYIKDTRENGARLMLKITKTGDADFLIRERLRTGPKKTKSAKRFTVASIEQPLAAVTERAKEMQQNILAGREVYYSPDAPKPEEVDLSPTFLRLHKDHQKYHSVKASTRTEYGEIFERYLVPWHDMQISKLTRDEILRLHREITDNGGKKKRIRAADQAIGYARALISSALENPAPDYEKPKSNIVSETMKYHKAWNEEGGQPERTSEPFPDDAWADTWLAINDLKNRVPNRNDKKRPTLSVTGSYYFKMLLFTGLRGGQVSTIEWRQIDLDRGTISWMEKEDTEKTKTSEKVFYLPVCHYVWDMLKEMRAREIEQTGECTGYLFKSLGNGKKGHVDTNMRTQWNMIKAQVPAIATQKPHDFRATFVSIGQNIGVNEVALKTLINHTTYKQQNVLEGYTKRKVEALRQQADKIANHFLEHVGEKTKAPAATPLPDYLMRLANSEAMKTDRTVEQVLERWFKMGSQLDRIESDDPQIEMIKRL